MHTTQTNFFKVCHSDVQVLSMPAIAKVDVLLHTYHSLGGNYLVYVRMCIQYISPEKRLHSTGASKQNDEEQGAGQNNCWIFPNRMWPSMMEKLLRNINVNGRWTKFITGVCDETPKVRGEDRLNRQQGVTMQQTNLIASCLPSHQPLLRSNKPYLQLRNCQNWYRVH